MSPLMGIVKFASERLSLDGRAFRLKPNPEEKSRFSPLRFLHSSLIRLRTGVI